MRLTALTTTASLIALTLTGCGAAKLHEATAPADHSYAPAEPGYGAPQAYGGEELPPGEPGLAAPSRLEAEPPASVARADSAGKAEIYRPAAEPKPAPKAVMARSSGVKAGEWDDNANYREFQSYLGTQSHLGFDQLDISDRQFIVVRDSAGKAVPGCRVAVTDDRQTTVTLRTQASGRAILFPHAEGLAGKELLATAICQGTTAQARVSLAEPDGVVDLRLNRARALPARRAVDIAFILDTTGSMSEEIAAVKDTIAQVAAELSGLNVDVRLGLVEYKDRSDAFVTRVYQLTGDIDGFADTISRIRASGGGDAPESVNEGLSVALSRLSFAEDAIALGFLIGDAPPHLDYPQDVSYTQSALKAAHRGIQLFTIAASGMDDVGQAVWRQIAQLTGGTNMFVLRGGAGPQSTGGGDPKSSCGGTQTSYASGNLDGLIFAKVKRALGDVDRDPLLIAGRNLDENAKPCHERLVIAH